MAAAPAPAPTPEPAQEPLSDQQDKLIRSIVDLSLVNQDPMEVAEELKQQNLENKYHAAIVTAILGSAIEK